ncbi:hypothetical protein DENSPDRAFT_859966 [Dentipellis sp. KUC8613]|nr:hypothetical protein DENSPDRAFT_859966 [Dentipellis sp. KUC8613]
MSLLAALLAGGASAHPNKDILNFALTLEHLENAFYTGGLTRFAAGDFANAGLPAWVYGRVKQIADHEATHVQFLESVLGDQAVQACEYNFAYDTPQAFLQISHALETVGTSAYVGASKFIQNKDYLLAAATILSTEARQSAWINSAVRKGAAWSGAFETPLDLNQVFTLAASFITSCPPNNTPLPVKAFPSLSLTEPTAAQPGATVQLQFDDHTDGQTPLFAAFLSGDDALVVPIDADRRSVYIPPELRGTVYLVLTTNGEAVEDKSTIAGPVMLEFAFNSAGEVETLPF